MAYMNAIYSVLFSQAQTGESDLKLLSRQAILLAIVIFSLSQFVDSKRDRNVLNFEFIQSMSNDIFVFMTVNTLFLRLVQS